MLISTTNEVANRHTVETLGIARGSTVRARHLGHDIFAGIKTMVGGEISEYTKLQADAREQAIERMTADAESMGANAIVGFRFESVTLAAGAAEVMAYGTAVTIDD